MQKIVAALILVSAIGFIENDAALSDIIDDVRKYSQDALVDVALGTLDTATGAADSVSFLLQSIGAVEDDVTGEFSNVMKKLRQDESSITRSIRNTVDKMPERVRTVEELRRRSSEHVVLDFIGLVQRRGNYTAEEYTLQSDDGYILKLHRVSGSPKSPKAPGKPVVYIQHCLLCSSDLFVEFGPEQGLALQLADNGYDVWLGNIRGNAYSRAHVKLSPDKDAAEFFKFSLDEPALLDIPKFVDFALEESNQKKLTFIGYSMGTTLSYIFLSGSPEYNDKVNLLINLAPADLFSRPASSQVELVVTGIPRFEEAVGLVEVLRQSVLIREVSDTFCFYGVPNLCTVLIGILGDGNNIAPEVLPEVFGYIPAGTSYYILKHYRQLTFATRKLVTFDWNEEGENCTSLVCSDSPKEYDLSLVTVPNVLLYGEKDDLVKLSDVEYLEGQLKNLLYSEKIIGFNHLDFAINKYAKSLVYDRVIEIMSQYLQTK